MDTSQSSQGFVRALKGQADPPQPGGPSKIEIARKAWDNQAFYVPNKGEVISDWLLTRLLKDKSKELTSNPVVDVRYWALLAEIIATSDKSRVVPQARPMKTWLGPILNRIPIAPIIMALFKLYPSLPEGCQKELSASSYRCLTVLWPMGVHKLSSDTLMECMGAVLSTFQWFDLHSSLGKIGQLVTTSFRAGLSNASSKKKLYTFFTQTHLNDWLNCASLAAREAPTPESLLENVYTAGADLLFNIDTLRAMHDTKSEHPIFQTLKKTLLTSPVVVFTVLPGLFASYAQNLKKARVALFSQGSNTTAASTEEVRVSCMSFFACCESLLSSISETKQTWNTRVSLLALVDSENLLGARQPEAEHVLHQMIEAAIKVLDSGYQVDHIAKTRLAIDVLTAITRINYDLVVSSIPRILPKLLMVTKPNESSFTFLDLLLNYHTKTRTMNAYISSLISAFSPKHIPEFSDGGRMSYQATSSGPLLSPIHLGRVTKFTRGFLTAGQTVETADFILHALKEAWEGLVAAEPTDDGSRKKRKLDAGSSTSTLNNNILAVSFSLIARMASVVLPSLPIKSVTQDVQEELRTLIETGHNSVVHSALKHTLKSVQKKSGEDGWAFQIASAAALRLQYSLTAAKGLGLNLKRDGKIAGKLLDVVGDDVLLPELSVEIFRSLMAYSTESDLIDPKIVLDGILAYLDGSFCPSGVSWSGLSCQLVVGQRGKQEGALALLYMVLERWLPVIDIFGSAQQLERLLKLAMTINVGEALSATRTELVPGLFLIQTLRSAGFWELPNIRNIFLAELVGKTAPLDNASVPTTPKKNKKLQSAVATYELLLLVPPEYLSRPARADFIRRALVADRLGSALSDGIDVSILTAVRVFLDRVFVLSGAVDHSQIPDFLSSLLESARKPEASLSPEYIAVTLDLIESHTHALLKLSDEISVQHSVDMVQSLYSTVSQSTSPAMLRIIEVLTKDFTAAQLPEPVAVELRSLLHHQTAKLQPLVALLSSSSGALSLDGPALLSAWCHTLTLKRWFGETVLDETSAFGRALLTKLLALKTSDVSDLCPSALSVLLEELLGSSETAHAQKLEICIAAYVAMYPLCGDAGKTEMDGYVSKTSKLLTVPDFTRILNLSIESLGDNGQSTENLASIIHLSDLVLRDAPQGTLKPIQSFATECFNLFTSKTLFTTGPIALRLRVLEFTGRHCSERPAALRLLDLSSIWALLSKFLAPSKPHDGETCSEVFGQASTIISALIRLRRDLVSLTLPHLGMILRQLFLTIRSVRPLLGAKQSKIVTDTLPLWVNVSQPLGPPESKILARLLGTLTTKTVARTHATTTAAVKAESLAKPFAKHAAYVLKAYIDAMNDPFCMLPSELRKELQPGLFTLCDMLSEHSRDAMMMSALDAGGKITLKSLWKEYEKQKYIGKG